MNPLCCFLNFNPDIPLIRHPPPQGRVHAAADVCRLRAPCGAAGAAAGGRGGGRVRQERPLGHLLVRRPGIRAGHGGGDLLSSDFIHRQKN